VHVVGLALSPLARKSRLVQVSIRHAQSQELAYYLWGSRSFRENGLFNSIMMHNCCAEERLFGDVCRLLTRHPHLSPADNISIMPPTLV
jgi:hypothetical protein